MAEENTNAPVADTEENATQVDGTNATPVASENAGENTSDSPVEGTNADESKNATPVADENTGENTNVAPEADANTENAMQANNGYVYYFSDPDSTEKELHCVVITLPYELPELPWHWHTEKPDDSFKDPVWETGATGWTENDKDNQAVILQQATEKLADLDQANDNVNQAVKAMQDMQMQTAQQNAALMQTLTEQTANTNKMLAAMQQSVMALSKQVATNATKPEENATPANTSTATDSTSTPA